VSVYGAFESEKLPFHGSELLAYSLADCISQGSVATLFGCDGIFSDHSFRAGQSLID